MPPVQVSLNPLSVLSSNLLALFFGFSYVGSLYAVKNARLRFSETRSDAHRGVQPGSRDDPAVIRARLTAVTFATLFNCGVIYALVARSTPPSVRFFKFVFARRHLLTCGQFDRAFASTLTILGVRWPDSILSSLQTPLLFLGPLYGSYLAGTLPGQSRYSLDHHFEMFWSWVGFRNYSWVCAARFSISSFS